MSTLSIHPSAAVALSNMASAVSKFVLGLLAPAPYDANSAEISSLYRMTRDAEAVAPAVMQQLDTHARAN